MKDGNGTRHPVLTPDQYPDSRRDDEKDRMFYYTPEYYAQNKLIAQNIFRMFNLTLPFGLSGNTVDELRGLTHLPNCMCYFCRYQDHKDELEADMWESEFSFCVLCRAVPCHVLQISFFLYCCCVCCGLNPAFPVILSTLGTLSVEVRLRLAKKGRMYVMSWREKEEMVSKVGPCWLYDFYVMVVIITVWKQQ